MSMRVTPSPFARGGGDDTIVAISSAAGGVRGIVRLSGPRAREIAAAACRPAGAEGAVPPGPDDLPVPRQFRPVAWPIPGSPVRVPAEWAWMPAPRSYTGEDVVEIHTLGSPPLLRLLAGRLAEAGARPAGPGEFTQRAFLNGRLDLARAEAVMAVIGASDRAALAGALAGLSGDLSRRCRDLERGLVALCADVEAAVDFTDQDIEILAPSEAASRAAELAAAAAALRAGASGPWRPGALVLLYGARNAGKSSLFNALAGSPRAIVSPVPGTTRDLLEADLAWEGVSLRLVDAAGVPAEAPVEEGPAVSPEADGVARLRCLAAEADVLLVVLDGSDPAGAAGVDRGLLAGRRGLVVLNKCDLGTVLDAAALALGGEEGRVARVSARTGEGLDRLRAAVAAECRGAAADGAGERLALTVRQAEALGRAAASLRRAAEALPREDGLALAAADLREALNAVGEITGRVATEDLLGVVFGRFCIGK